MTKPTKQQVLDCNDIQQLHKWAWLFCCKRPMPDLESGSVSDHELHLREGYFNWKPCLQSTIGKVQAIELAEKYGMEISFNDKYVSTGAKLTIWFFTPLEDDWPCLKNENFADTWQIAVVKVAIISEIED